MAEIVNKVDQAFNISNAYTWEGSARCYFVSETKDIITLEVHGNSSIEHDGDISGIESQVRDLENEETKVDGEQYRILSATMNYTYDDEGHHGDEDRTINIKGLIKIRKL